MLADNWVAPAHPNVAVGHKACKRLSRLGFDLSDENSLISAPFILATYSRFHNKLDPRRTLVSRTAIVVSPCSFACRVVMQYPNSSA
jgi:hypothetical protein